MFRGLLQVVLYVHYTVTFYGQKYIFRQVPSIPFCILVASEYGYGMIRKKSTDHCSIVIPKYLIVCKVTCHLLNKLRGMLTQT